MTAYIVTYDLASPGQNYNCIKEKLQEYDLHWHMQKSVWIVVTEWSSVQVRDDLIPCLDSNDTLFVGELGPDAAWHGLSDDGTAWLKSVL